MEVWIKDSDESWYQLNANTQVKDSEGLWHTFGVGSAIKDSEGLWHEVSFDGGGVGAISLSASPNYLPFGFESGAADIRTVTIHISNNVLGWSINTVSDAWINTTVIGDTIKVWASVNIAHSAPYRNGSILIESDDDSTIQFIINVHQDASEN